MDQAYLFNTGKDYQSYNLLGSKPITRDGVVSGFSFLVWAPKAKAVCVIGDFNDWQKDAHIMTLLGETGIWTCDILGAKQWDRYKYRIEGDDGIIYEKIDPYARHFETRPNNASIVYDPNDYVWGDEAYQSDRQHALAARPLNIYEIHLGSWRRHKDGNCMNYRDIGRDLALYCNEMGYTHVEIMPVMEHPLDASWGYQVTGYFAVTSRFGTPADFKFMVDTLHQQGIGVILDWVPAHFPKNTDALARFDGSHCYEYADPRIGEHKGWGTCVFNYEKAEIRSFLVSNVIFWIEEFHVDGLRVDAVSSMIYRNYARQEFLPNHYGGTDNLEAIDFIRFLNALVRERYPHIMMIAEESTAWPKVSHDIADGGLGFSHKWNMGWMHDTLDYFSTDYYARNWHHDKFSFSLMYAFSENFIVCFSHDEVVHGKKSLLDKMPGDYWRKFASYRTMLAYMIAHPGGKLLFMGAEFGPFIEWRFYEELEWFLLKYESHRRLHEYVKTINSLYRNKRALWLFDRSWDGFEWLDTMDRDNSVFLLQRKSDDPKEAVIVVLNMIPVAIPRYKIPVEHKGAYRVVLNSDDTAFGGSGYALSDDHADVFYSVDGEWKGKQFFVELPLPPLSALYLQREDAP